jgi:hypothetical protein
MNIANINSRITFLTSLGTDIYLPADRLLAVNKYYDQLHSIILESQDEWDFDDSNATDLPIAATELTINIGTYALPSTIYRLNKVEINYGAGFIKALPLDLNETGLSEDEVLSRVSVESPRYRIFGQTIKLYPTPTATVASGLKLYFDREVAEFTSAEVTTGTKKPGLDRLWHDYLSIGASVDGAIKFSLSNLTSLETKLQDMENRIRKYYGEKNVDRKYKVAGLIEDYS